MLTELRMMLSDYMAGKPVHPRSTHWPKARAEWLAEHPLCEACGGSENPEVHHKVPVSFDPTMEMVKSNWITLCEHPGRNCHLRYGHCFNWKARNPNVVHDCYQSLQSLNLIEYNIGKS